MPINWNETLLGAASDETGPGNRASAPLLDALRRGQLAGVLAAAMLVAVALAAVSVTSGLNLPFLIGASGLLLASVLAFAALHRFGERAVLAPLIAATAGLAAAIPFGVMPVLGMAGLVATGFLWQREAHANRMDALLAIAVAAIGISVLTLVVTGFAILPSALVLAVLVPQLVAIQRYRAARVEIEAARAHAEGLSRVMIETALARLPAMRAIVDATGRAEPLPAQSRFSELVAEAGFDATALIDRALIADRPKLLKALSDAIHANRATPSLDIRLRDAEEAAGIAPRPGYRPVRLAILPAHGLAGRAVVLAEEASAASGSAPVGTPGANSPAMHGADAQGMESELLARAFHDSVSPFNAGLGYLEMIADPRLAPHDIGVFRGYAREAMGAVREAHRNASLMSRWIRLSQMQALPAPEQRPFGEIAGDAIRALHLGGEGQNCELRIDPASAGLVIDVAIDPARFALAVLLRGLIANCGKTGRVTLSAGFEGAALVVTPMIEPVPQRIAGGDMFQHALERAAGRFGGFRFERGADGLARLFMALSREHSAIPAPNGGEGGAGKAELKRMAS